MCCSNMWGGGAAARSQSCLSFDVAVVRVELQPSQTTAERRNDSTAHDQFHITYEYPEPLRFYAAIQP